MTEQRVSGQLNMLNSDGTKINMRQKVLCTFYSANQVA